jgi:hypothetical protein
MASSSEHITLIAADHSANAVTALAFGRWRWARDLGIAQTPI